MREMICVFGVFLLFLPNVILAQDKPTPEEAKKVIDYYYGGKGKGVVLVDHKLCQEIYEAGVEKYECRREIADREIRKGQELYLWMRFLVPAGDKAEILLQFRRKDKVRKVLPIVLPGSLRYRTWKKIPTDKTGTWEVTFVQEMEDRDFNLGSLQYSVVGAKQ
ncbi:MAG: hypothetical protein GTO12_25615 [Proteobacteria bacterium]|nr:hypothetical protein [Pseudomonadota bacterium]